jgi:hypothetical protein
MIISIRYAGNPTPHFSRRGRAGITKGIRTNFEMPIVYINRLNPTGRTANGCWVVLFNSFAGKAPTPMKLWPRNAQSASEWKTGAKQTETLRQQRDQMPANTTTRSQRRFHRHIADPHLSESPNHANLPEPDRDTQQNITGHRTYPQHRALAARPTTIFQHRCLRCSLSPSANLFSGQRVRAHSGFWPEPQRADHSGRMMGALWQKRSLFLPHKRT